VMSTGVEIAADIRTLPILCDHVGEDLSDPVVTPGGDGLLFRSAAIEVGLPGILAAIRANEQHRRSKPSAT
jgi:hypothetical protein